MTGDGGIARLHFPLSYHHRTMSVSSWLFENQIPVPLVSKATAPARNFKKGPTPELSELS
jgi:hypothetical protein